MELGFHIADFTWTDGPRGLGPELARTAQEAEAGGIARLTVMDHLWQFGPVGAAEEAMLEAYTTLGYLAAVTERVKLHTLVSAVSYRPPGLLAKMVSTLDVLCGGRAGLGIGVGVYEAEAQGLGLPFPSLSERFERLEETLRICGQMWSGEDGDAFAGEHYHLARTLNSPAPLTRPRPYLLVAGGGERKTLRLVARYADACNIFGTGDAARHKLDVLRTHCGDVGRDPSEIETTTMLGIDATSSRSQLLTRLRAAHEAGISVAYIWARNPEPRRAVELIGSTVDEVTDW